MNRRRFLKTLGFSAAALTLSGCNMSSQKGSSDALGDKRPNIIIIFTDDQGTLDANCYGSKDLYTPNMDALAKRGIRFTQAYAHTVCCPSRAPLLTWRHTQRCGVNEWTPCHPDRNHPFGKGPNMRLEEITIAEILKSAGYRTALFGKWHLGATPGYGPNEQGFDEFFGHLGGFIDNYSHEFLHGKPFHDLYRNDKEVFEDGNYFPDLIVRECHRFLDADKKRPFFMYVAFNVPHYPEQADTKFTKMYEDMPMPRRSYAAMVSTTDDRMGQILKKVDQLGLRDNTMVIWMSDNGHSTEYCKSPDGRNYGPNGGGGNTGRWRGAKGSFLEGGIRLPAVISLPGRIPQGQVRNQMVWNGDFFPTILETCNLPLPDGKIDGKSLWPILRSAKAPSPHKVMHWQWEKQWAVRKGDWKLIVNGRDTTGLHTIGVQKHRPMYGAEGRMEPVFLGNLADDLPESKNYADERPDIVKRLTKLHEAWAKDVNRPFNK